MHTKRFLKRAVCALLAAVFTATLSDVSVAQTYRQAPVRPTKDMGRPLYTQKLPGDRQATIYSSGVAEIVSQKLRTIEYRLLPGAFNSYLKDPQFQTDKLGTAAQLAVPQLPPFVSGRVLVVFGSGVGVSQDTFKLPASTVASMRTSRSTAAAIVPTYTSSYRVNAAFAKLGVDGYERIGRSVSRGRLQAMRAMASSVHPSTAIANLDLSNAYRVHLTGTDVMSAVRTLKTMPGIAYVSPDFTVRTMNAPAVSIPEPEQRQAMARHVMRSTEPPSYKLPSNYALAASAQPMLGTTGVDAVAAFDEVFRRYGQLPGQGVTITNVSIGDLDDASVGGLIDDPCSFYVGFFGPTTRMIDGQRYLDLPSMPLIPAYTAKADGSLSGTDEVCGTDPVLGEIGMDFSVMSPLPHDQQRGGATGTGFSDLLGIAPGASYRLVVPKSAQPAISDLIGAFLGAANQTPAPDIITASIGFGTDAYGFPSRYFEDDPLVSSAISNIVNGQNIVVAISANDGLRTFTNASVGPSGGSAPTNLASQSSAQTTMSDVAYSSVPSYDGDSGAIDVGGTTLNDISAFNPADPANANVNGATVPETRYTGFSAFSSGFGSRVNVSAPSDNVVVITHARGGSATQVQTQLSGGTSASAPEVAAAAAVLVQVARLSGHPFSKATDVRALLEQTAVPVMQTPQTDQPLNVGPQIDLARAVEKLLAATGLPVKPGVPRVAIMQRRGGRFNLQGALDTLFVANTDPAYIDLMGPFDQVTQQNSGENAQSPITIAPDWEGLPAGTKFALTVAGNTTPIATGSSARLFPQQILQAAGMTLVSPTQRTVKLTYRAYEGLHSVITTSFQLTFGPAQATSELVQAPVVAPVVTGPVMTVSYDFSAFPSAQLAAPSIMVSYPGRINTATGNMYFPAYFAPIAAGSTKGTVSIPVSALSGDGMYGVQLLLNRYTGITSDFTPVRVATAGTSRATAPVFVTQDPTSGAQVKSHYLENPYGGSFTVSYDVSNVPDATSAVLEISAAGNNFYGNLNPFNNPNGSVPDFNRADSGSVYQQVLPGTKGQVTLKESDAHLVAGLNHVVRVIPMKGGQPAGEASDVSYIAEDGVVPGDGGSLYDGYGINVQGNDGLLTSFQWTADGSVLKSVQRFAQDSMTANTVLASNASGCNAFFVPANAVFGSDSAVVQSWDSWGGCMTLYPITYNSIPNLASATGLGPSFTPPLATPTNIVFSTNSISGAPTGKGSFLTLRWDMAYGGTFSAQTFLGDVGANTFSTPIDLDSLNLVQTPVYGTMDYDSASGMGYIVADQLPWFGIHYPTSIIAANYAAGTATAFKVNGCGSALDFELDPSTHVGALTTRARVCDRINGLQILDLTSQTARSVGLPSAVALTPPTLVSTDPVNHLFFVQVPLSADAASNNNALSSVVELDESGRVRSSIEAFNFLSSVYGNHFFEVNPALRRGFVFGPNFAQIQPFSY